MGYSLKMNVNSIKFIHLWTKFVVFNRDIAFLTSALSSAYMDQLVFRYLLTKFDDMSTHKVLSSYFSGFKILHVRPGSN